MTAAAPHVPLAPCLLLTAAADTAIDAASFADLWQRLISSAAVAAKKTQTGWAVGDSQCIYAYVFGKESSSSVRSAAVAALAARVRFTCAAYIPVSRCLLSAADARRSSLDSSQQEQHQDAAAAACCCCVAAEAAGAAADLCCGLHAKQQAAEASTAEGRHVQLAALCSVDLRNSQTVIVVPACCWIRRACRSLVRTALVERRLLLLARPQRPLSLVEAILCQWKLLLQKQLAAAECSEAQVRPASADAVCEKKKCETSWAAGNVLLLATPLPSKTDARVAEALRSFREPHQITKLLAAAAQKVRQKIAAVQASAWQLPPAEWWPSVSHGGGAAQVRRRLGRRTAKKRHGHGFRGSSNVFCRNRSGICRNKCACGDTCSSSSISGSGSDRRVCSRTSGNFGRNDTHCSERDKKREPRKCRSAKKQVELSDLQASANVGSRKTVYDVVTGEPLLQAELEDLLRVLDNLKSRPVSDFWRQGLPLSEPDICLRLVYSKEFALRIAQTCIKSLVLLESVTHRAQRTVQDTQKRAHRKALMTGLRSVDGVEEQQRKNADTAMPSGVTSLDLLLLSTVAGECELLVKAAGNTLHAALCGSDILHTTKENSKQSSAAAASYTQPPFICLPTPAWQLLHPIAVQPWDGQSMPVDLLHAFAVVQKQSGVSQREERGRAQQRETHSDPQHTQRERQHEHEPLELLKQRFLHDQEEPRRPPAPANGQEGHSFVGNARATQDERPGGGPGNNIVKHRQRGGGRGGGGGVGGGDNPLCVSVGGQQEQRNCTQVAARLRQIHPPASSAECLHEAPEQQEHDHCKDGYPLLRENQDTELTLQVLASAKQCRQRAASERDAIEALLSAIRQRSSLPTDNAYGPKR